jgi:hypothetical protein
LAGTGGEAMSTFAVTDYGAVGDGVAKDTQPIQRAIDACGRAGGGVVLIPTGTYLSGTLYLRDNVCLDLAPGSRLLGSPDAADYNTDDFCVQNRATPGEKASGAHLLAGVEVKNVTIRGGGRIDGNSAAFFAVPADRPDTFVIPGWRPGQMLFLCECENVSIEGVELFNAPYWTCFLHGCDRVFVRGVRIWNDRRSINGDGIDVDCCRQVVISDCLVESGDDCLTLRANAAPLKQPRPCEDVVVTNCILKTRANGVRVGVGNGVIRQALFSNLIIGGHALDGICIQSNYCYHGNLNEDQSGAGVEISDLRFDNIQMTDVCSALYVAPGYAGGKAISDLYFHNLHARAAKGSVIKGTPTNAVRRVVLSRVDIRLAGDQKLLLAPERWDEPTFEWDGCLPAALYLEHCQDVELDRCRLEWGVTTGAWRHTVWGRYLTGLRMTECRLQSPPNAPVGLQLDECGGTDIRSTVEKEMGSC